jgi:hypothetical protein
VVVEDCTKGAPRIFPVSSSFIIQRIHFTLRGRKRAREGGREIEREREKEREKQRKEERKGKRKGEG